VTGRQGKRRRKLLDDLKEKRGYSHLKEEALDRTMCRARFGRGFGPVVRQTAKLINSRSGEKKRKKKLRSLFRSFRVRYDIRYQNNDPSSVNLLALQLSSLNRKSSVSTGYTYVFQACL
jgi:hypothetical protein